MKILEILSEECRRGDHERVSGKRGCRGRGRINDPKTRIGHYAGEQVRTWCPCPCHQAPVAAAKPEPYELPRAAIPPLVL